jgi:broad specificity phosphatase PhoE
VARVYLIRHGRPSATWGGDVLDPGLDQNGRLQAAHAAEVLFSLPEGLRPDRVASSPMRRCVETAQPLAQALGLETEIVDAVSEIPTPAKIADRGDWLGRSLRGRWADIRGDLNYGSWRDAVVSAVVARPGAAIFTHFVAINAVASKLSGEDDVTVFRPGHAAITILEIDKGELRIVRLGEEAATGVL